jgi:Rubrerythrin, rubredoxin-like domain
LTAKRTSEADSLQHALGAVLEGVAFYTLAQIVSADTRVKVTFEDLGRRKAAQLVKLEAVTGPAAKDSAFYPNLYPLDAVSKAECYVCGHMVETKNMPNQCPKCGTARYTFEKEIALSKAWEIAGESSRKSAELFRESAAGSSGKVRALLEELAQEDMALAAQAGKELAELRS